mgnify:FL=1
MTPTEKKMEQKAFEILERWEKEEQWLEQNADYVKEKYDQKLIAIKDNAIIAAASWMEEIIDAVEKQGLDPSEVMVRYISKIPVIL